MIGLVAAPSPLWFFARSAGFISLAMLTASASLGILVSMRRRSRTWPLFVTDELHRYMTLVFFAFLVLHIVTVLYDPFTRFRPVDVLVPFLSPYRRAWMGLGILAAELSLALAVSGWLRGRIGYRTFRALHYATYAIFPLALIHGLATGSDTRNGWGLAIYLAAGLAVAVPMVSRLLHNLPAWAGLRVPGMVAGALGLLLLVGWLAQGPLAPGWVRASGTPDALLSLSPGPVSSPSTPAPPPTPLALAQPFIDNVTGTVSKSTEVEFAASGAADGTVALTWSLHAVVPRGQQVAGTLDISRDGTPICSATLTRLTEQGFIASCAPANSQGRITFLLSLQQASTGSALTGQLQVSGG